MASTEKTTRASEETIRSLAAKLQQYVGTLPEEEKALLEHVLLTALPPLTRRLLSPESNRFSNNDRALLDNLTLRE